MSNDNNDLEKSLEILKQINKLDNTEMPVFTWDEVKSIEHLYFRNGFLLGLVVVPIILGPIFMILINKIHIIWIWQI